MSQEILIIAELLQGALQPVSFEAAAFGIELAASVGGEAKGIVLGSSVAGLAEEFSKRTGLGVLAVDAVRILTAPRRDLADREPVPEAKLTLYLDAEGPGRQVLEGPGARLPDRVTQRPANRLERC